MTLYIIFESVFLIDKIQLIELFFAWLLIFVSYNILQYIVIYDFFYLYQISLLFYLAMLIRLNFL